MSLTILRAAVLHPSGNPTCILPAELYAVSPEHLDDLFRALGVEQLGAVVASGAWSAYEPRGDMPPRPAVPMLRMMGGELSLNGLASAFVAIQHWHERQARFTFACDLVDGVLPVSGSSVPSAQGSVVALHFPAFPHQFPRERRQDVSVLGVVALRGITHILLESPAAGSMDLVARRLIGEMECVRKAPATGFVFVSHPASGYRITPYVYVRAFDLLTPETSCGSGAVALALELWRRAGCEQTTVSIGQPSGAQIAVAVRRGANGSAAAPAVDFRTTVRWLADALIELDPPRLVEVRPRGRVRGRPSPVAG